jgi:hypothetical protein
VDLTRTDFQRISRTRLREARFLLRNNMFDGAYHLTGLALECALKACISRRRRAHVFPDKDFAKQCYTHDLNNLLKLAELTGQWRTHSDTDAQFSINWGIVKDFDIESRYRSTLPAVAAALYRAATARTHGVMTWLRQYW